MARLLFMAPGDDAAKRFSLAWLHPLAEQAEDAGHHVVLVKTATRGNLELAVRRHDPDFILLNGHGARNAVAGLGAGIVAGTPGVARELRGQVVTFDNTPLLAGPGRIVFLFTCWAMQSLGPALADQGALGVAGWTRPFLFDVDDLDPARDAASVPYFEAALEVPRTLLRGSTLGAAVARCQGRLAALADEDQDRLRRAYALYDAKHMSLIGDSGATLAAAAQRPRLTHALAA